MSQIIEKIRNKKFMTFDCYGTLIDWETGILEAISPVFERQGIEINHETILKLYAKFEAKAEEGKFQDYKHVLRTVMASFFSEFNIKPAAGEQDLLVSAISTFQPFPDTVEALNSLGQRFKLCIISNVDRDIFKQTKRRLEVKFSHIITSDMVGSYKPSRNNFNYALDVMKADINDVVHVAQSVFHDIQPAAQLGITTVKINRSRFRLGYGATPMATTKADLIVDDLKALVEIIEHS